MPGAYPGAQKNGEPSQQEVEVEAGGGEDGVDTVAIVALEVIAVHPMLRLQMADDGLDRRSSFHLSLYGGRRSSELASDADPELLRVAVAFV